METIYTETTQAGKPTTKSIGLIALIILLSCWGLFYLDHKTRSVTDLFKPGNLVALLLYFVPTFSICLLFFSLFLRKNDTTNSIVLSLLVGIPAGFILMITVLYFWMH